MAPRTPVCRQTLLVGMLVWCTGSDYSSANRRFLAIIKSKNEGDFQDMTKQLFAVIIVITLILVGVFTLTKEKGSESESGKSTASASEHVEGAGNKGVTLIEYGDFECPACKAYYPIIKQIKQTYKDDIKFQFRHFPLVQSHPNAMAAHRAAEAAGKQGKFFEMHDLLYENQDSWKAQTGTSSSAASTQFETFAQQLGLDMVKYKSDVASESTNNIINADRREGNAIGANSTPTFVINGKKLEKLPQTLDEFKKLIDEAIKTAEPKQ